MFHLYTPNKISIFHLYTPNKTNMFSLYTPNKTSMFHVYTPNKTHKHIKTTTTTTRERSQGMRTGRGAVRGHVCVHAKKNLWKNVLTIDWVP
jgi:hypothetical protein